MEPDIVGDSSLGESETFQSKHNFVSGVHMERYMGGTAGGK